MELPDFRQFAFVINNLYFNSRKRLVFMASTKEINIQNISSKKLTQVPSGKFKHVRFDVDDARALILLSDAWSQLEDICKEDPNTIREYIDDTQKISSCAQAIKELSLPEGFSRLINLSSIDEYRSYVVWGWNVCCNYFSNFIYP
jgi:hypothetical protein